MSLAPGAGRLTLQGSTKLLKIDRLIPRYVTHVSASRHTEVFTLTEKGAQLARLIDGNSRRRSLYEVGGRPETEVEVEIVLVPSAI
jgi:hypothetical protein